MSDTEKRKQKITVPTFTWVFLSLIGCFDLLRGLMHTVFMEQAIATFAHLDFAATNINDQLFQMNTLGISNIISGILFIVVALKAKDYADVALLYPVISHVIGAFAIRINNVDAGSDFFGQFVMIAYMGFCTLIFIASRICTARTKKKTANEVKNSEKEIIQNGFVPKLAPKVQFILGIVDLIRAIAHTLAILIAAANVAGYDFTDPQIDDLLVLMVAFGISNITTGLLHITIARKAPKYADFVLLMIPITYFLGVVNLRTMGIIPQSKLSGQYIMIVYFAVCILTFIYTRVRILIHKRKTQ